MNPGGDWSLSLAGNGDTDAARAAFQQFLAVLNASGSNVNVTSGQFTASEGVEQLAAAPAAVDPAAQEATQ